MDFHQENQFEDGFHQIEDKRGSDQEAEKLKGSRGQDENPRANEGTVKDPASTIRICDFCGKTFNNGKALGGHRRYHLQALRKEAAQSQKVKIRLPKPKNYSNSNSVNDVDEDNIIKMEALMSNGGKPTCDLCHKDFPSMKSYYGHMRCHPERDRRGVLHPLPCLPNSDDDSMEQKEDNCVTNSTVIAPEESPIDLTKSLSSWAKTDIRGRKSIGGAEAAQSLVHLSRGEYFSAPESCVLLPQAASSDDAVEAKGSTSGVAMQCKKRKVDDSSSRKQKVRKMTVYRRESLKLGDKIDENDDGGSQTVNGGKYLSECGNGKIMNMDDEVEGANWGEEECEKNMKDDDSHLDESKMMMKKKEKKRKKILKLKSPQNSESEENPLIKTLKARDGYKCRICGKSFATFQALGGHRSSHNKEKNIRTMDESDDNNGAGFIPQMNETKGSEFRGLVVEEADSAQALGDHHRRSYSTGLAETPLSEEASSVEASLSHSTQERGEASPLAPRVLEFDLNEPYVTDDKATKSTFFQE